MSTQEQHSTAPKREKFGSRISFVLASMGGAIGLGAVWKFPYMVGRYGGAAFILVFLASLLLIATPILITEFAIGRKTQTSYTSALRILCPGKKWYLLGIMGVATLTLTLSFYTGIAGWTLAYLFKSAAGAYAGMGPSQVETAFNAFIANPWLVMFWLLAMLAITTFVVMRGIKGGIEKVCNVLLPVMFLFILVLALRSILLPGSGAGLKFYLKPDFSSLTGEGVMAAIGQSFFTLGVGCGNLVVYGSYLDKKKTIGSSTFMVALGDTVASVLFGFIIFPSAFAFGIRPNMGPPLVFITLPTIFSQMKFGMAFASLFFLLLFFACLTSTICIMEAIVGYLVDEFKMGRKKATWITAAVTLALGAFLMMSFGPMKNVLVMGRTFFDFANDILVSTVLLPLGGLLMVVLIGWIRKPKSLLDEINTGDGIKCRKYYVATVKFIAPVAIILMFLQMAGILHF